MAAWLGLPLLLQMVGAATGASVAVGLLHWSFLWLMRGGNGGCVVGARELASVLAR